MRRLVRRRTDCRACHKRKLVQVLDLGKTPPANAFLNPVNPPNGGHGANPVKLRHGASKEQWFPLQVNLCKNCGMVQLAHVVDPKLLFENYVYVSSTSPVFVGHFEYLAKKIIKQLKLPKNSLIIDIGSNDGILLKPFKKRGMRVLGIEPAKNIAKRANQDGIPTKAEFFSIKLAKKIVSEYSQADLITATNVFAHIDNLDEVVEGVKILLKPEGVFLIEVAYLGDLVKKNLFDTVYHEHLCYWGVKPLKVLIDRLGMKIFKVQHVATHGGSIRVLTKLGGAGWPVMSSVGRFVDQEKRVGLRNLATYRTMTRKLQQNKRSLNQLLLKLEGRGKTIVGFGAPAKSTTLLNYFKIGKDVLDYIVDDSPYKQGLYTPGTHIPVVEPLRLYQDKQSLLLRSKPDYVLILAWNFAESIMKAHQKFKRLGGKFIIPVPRPKIE